MSFHEVAFIIRAVNRASSQFDIVAKDSRKMAADVGSGQSGIAKSTQENIKLSTVWTSELRKASTALMLVGTSGLALTHVARAMGILDESTARTINTIFMTITVVGGLIRILTTGAIAHKIYAAACWISTVAQNTLNISFATFLALTVVGIAVLVAAAIAVAAFANNMNSATESVSRFNSTSLGSSPAAAISNEMAGARRGD